VRRPHLHTLWRDAPLRLIDIEFLPAGTPQLCSPNKSSYDVLQGQPGDRIAGIRIELLDEVQKPTLQECGPVLHLASFQAPFHICGWVVGRPAGLDGIAKNGTGPLQDPGCDTESAAIRDFQERRGAPFFAVFCPLLFIEAVIIVLEKYPRTVIMFMMITESRYRIKKERYIKEYGVTLGVIASVIVKFI
jgi:hypothetical protein